MTATIRSKNPQTVAERFWSKVTPAGPESCWPWKGCTNTWGYGVMSRGRKYDGTILAHRVAYLLRFGAVPNGLCVCHHCDNRRCVNPAHLFLGTRMDNSGDMKAKKRARKGPLSPCKLTSADARYIRSNASRSRIELADQFGVTQGCIFRVLSYKSWAHA